MTLQGFHCKISASTYNCRKYRSLSGFQKITNNLRNEPKMDDKPLKLVEEGNLRERIGRSERPLAGMTQRKQWPILKKQKAALSGSSKKKVFFQDKNVCEGYLQITTRKGIGDEKSYVLAGSLKMMDKKFGIGKIILPNGDIISDFKVENDCYVFKTGKLKELIKLEDVFYELL